MLEIITVILCFLLLVVLGLLIWLIITNSASRRDSAVQMANVSSLQQQLDSIKSAQDKTSESLQKSLQTGQVSLNENLQSSQKVLGMLNTQIGELQGTNKQMLTMGSDVKRLQNILSSPKLRGQMGERSLENLLMNIMPKNNYKLQYAFKDGKVVDALIQAGDYSVPVDAKFPLPAFEKVVNAENEEEKKSFRTQFHKDVISHIDKISENYIRPAEGTLDFAFMYIPAENVYYETIVMYAGEVKDILEYALEKKVIPVSPNLLHTYLMTVVMGLHGLQIEKQAAEIRQNLKKLNASYSSFTNSWGILGTHMRNANNQYSEGDQKLNRFGVELTQIQSDNEDNLQ